MATSAHRLHGDAIEEDPGALVAIPAPGLRSPDRIHHQLLEHLRQRTPPDVERGEREHVDAHVVVFVRAPGLEPRARSPLGRLATRAIRPLRLPPERAFPVARLPEQVIPRDLAIVRRLERQESGLAVRRRLAYNELDRRHGAGHAILHASNEPSIERETHGRREKALGDAEGHVDAVGIAPLRHDVAVAQDDTGRIAARLERTDGFTVRLAGEALVVRGLEIARLLRLARLGERDRVLELTGIEPDLRGRAALPFVARTGIVDGLPLGRGAGAPRLWCGDGRGQ